MKKIYFALTVTFSVLMAGQKLDAQSEQLGTFESTITNIQSVGVNSGMLNSLSTFSGWGGPVGIKDAFNYFEFNVDPWDKKNPITQIRARVLEKTYTGKILVDKTQNVKLIPAGRVQKVSFILPKMIKSNSNLYFEFYTNGRTGREETVPPFQTSPMGRYSTNKSVKILNTVQQNVSLNPYVTFGVVSGTKFIPNIALKKQIDPHYNADIEMPSKIYGVTGMKSELYYDNILKSWFSDPMQQYNLEINSSYGSALSEKYEFIPKSAGNHNIRINLNYGQETISSKNVVFQTVSNLSGANKDRKLLFIGDSL